MLRLFPFGLELLNRKLFLEAGSIKMTLIFGLVILLVVIIISLISQTVFHQKNFFRINLNKLTCLLLGGTIMVVLVNLLVSIFLKDINQSNFGLSFMGVIFYYFTNVLFQQTINFGFLQGELLKNGKALTVNIFVSIIFSLSHLLAVIEGAEPFEILMLVSIGFLLGLASTFLRERFNSVIPGFLIHFSGYVMLNGPLVYLLVG